MTKLHLTSGKVHAVLTSPQTGQRKGELNITGESIETYFYDDKTGEILSGFYGVIVEFFLLPLRLYAEWKMNEEMDLEDD